MSGGRRLTPETKTLRLMINGRGMVAAIASRRIRKLSFDLFGFVDVIGFVPRLGMAGHEKTGAGAASFLLVQATSSSNQAARKKKILNDAVLRGRAFALIESGHHVEVWGWVSGRRPGNEAVRRWLLAGRSPALMIWHDLGISEVADELLDEPPRR